MSTKSKSSITYILALAIILFVTAIIWKLNYTDNSEQITVPPVASITKNIKAPKERTKAPIIVENTATHNSPLKFESENPDKEIANEFYNFNSKLAALRTPESLVAAIKDFRKKGEFEKAERVIDKLILVFPDHEIPD
jgi:hypothetical protein